jgi:predicted Zn-dependent peptidase
VRSSFAALALSLALAAPLAAEEVRIPYEKFVLDNGLTLIVHEDHKAPVVAVSIWYHVGSKDEKPGRTGFAHLFEHLMFQGSEHYNDEYFKPFELVGATDMNGTTWLDRTNYFQTVPKTALDLALWMESDRMGHLLGVIDQARLDEQRDVVKNEKRQGENEPYGRVFEALQRASFPEGHPYRWETIGSMEDLEAATLEDVHEWFKTYYGAANATLVLAGDITPAEARAKVEKYFGHIPPGPPLSRLEAWVAPRQHSSREVMQDRVAQARIYRTWNVAQRGTTDAELLEVAARIFGQGKTSRLYQRLVYRDQIADSAAAYPMIFELAGMFLIQADVKVGVDPVVVEQAIEEELARFLKEGPTKAELERAKIEIESDFIRGIEKVGGFAGKAGVLAECEVYDGDPGCYRTSLAIQKGATPEQVRVAAQRWLAQGDHTLLVVPFGQYKTAESQVDRKAGVPQVAEFPEIDFPRLERARLKNGIEVVLASRPGIPLIHVELLFAGGSAADRGRPMGTASFTYGMLDEGAGGMDALQIAEKADLLGAQIYAASGLDFGYVGVSALSARIDDSLDLLATLVRKPEFPEKEIERVRKQWLASIAQEKTQPFGIGLRLLPPLLYGEGHPYAIPFSGSGTEDSIQSLKREDLVAYHRDFVRPDNARVLVAGDTTMAAILPLLEKHFGSWRAPASPRPAIEVPTVAPPAQPRVYLIDRKEAPQSLILAGLLAPSTMAPNATEIGTMNAILGGSFTSRINMNLREDKHWTYGAGISLSNARGQRPWFVYAPVQADKTAESIAEIQREIAEYIGDKPATAEEIDKIKARDVRSLPGAYETIRAVQGALRFILQFDRPDDWIQGSKARIEGQTPEAIRAAAREVIRPDSLTWVVVGDLSKIEGAVRALQLGAVQVLDENGKPLR